MPQGAPTSPALANLCAFRLDCRLAGLARALGTDYTRYADDLVFSGGPDFAQSVDRFAIHVGAITLEEGFAVQTRKTRIMRRGVRQQVAGVVVNARLNVGRTEYDARKGSSLQLRPIRTTGPEPGRPRGLPADLAGRVAYVASLNPARGVRLRELFDRIGW